MRLVAADTDLETLARHDIEVLTVAPELRAVVPNERETLTSAATPEERTRYYPPSRTRRIAHGIVELMGEVFASRGPHSLVIEQVGAADPTDLEWLAIALRRIDSHDLCIVVCTPGDIEDEALAVALTRHAARVSADQDRFALAHEAATFGQPDDADEMARQFIASECTSDDQRLSAGYQLLPAERRAAMHDARADELATRDEMTLRVGAIPFHREHGANPRNDGAAALLTALEYCMLQGFYPAVIDLARRSYAVLDWATRPEDCWLVTAKITLALAALGRPDDALARYDDACAQSALPKVHLRAAYGRAMLYTRYYQGERRDQAKAKAWINCAIALSSLSPDPAQRAFNLSFNENALALIEMHLGNPEKALKLITANLQHLDEDLTEDGQVLHRSVMLYNRAQLLDRYGDPAEALVEYTKLINADPHQSEYYLQRAAVRRRLEDVTGARDDYAEAIRLSPPYPEPHQQRAELALAIGDIRGALDDLGYVLELAPEAIDARVIRAGLLLEVGAVDDAADDVAKGLEIDPEHAELHLIRAMLARQGGDAVVAHEAFTAALAGDPTLTAGWSNRAVLWYEQGEFQRAIDDLTRALELDDDPDIRENRAIAYTAAGQLAEAAADRELLAGAA